MVHVLHKRLLVPSIFFIFLLSLRKLGFPRQHSTWLSRNVGRMKLQLVEERFTNRKENEVNDPCGLSEYYICHTMRPTHGEDSLKPPGLCQFSHACARYSIKPCGCFYMLHSGSLCALSAFVHEQCTQRCTCIPRRGHPFHDHVVHRHFWLLAWIHTGRQEKSPISHNQGYL